MSPITLENCNQIITNLFLGGVNAALQTQVLKDQGIRAVVCCLRELEFPTCDFGKDLEYYRVDVEDMGCEPIELFWPEATEFIHSWISHGQPVLVHCRAGVSRSASTVIAYLVKYQNYSLHDAFILARERRPVVTPNIGFMQKLCDFEASDRGTKATIAMPKYSSWYCGSQLSTIPDVGTDDILIREHVPENSSVVATGDDSERPIAVADDTGPQTTMSKRFRAASEKVMSILSLLDLDMPDASSEDSVVQGRVETIRTTLMRHAAQDPELGYCQGMHLVAALFVAVSVTQPEAYWRFNAFVGGIRGLWLPGFPLLEVGAARFKDLAEHRPWFQHLRDNLVEPDMYLPRAWLSVFAAWLPLHYLVECGEILEAHGLAGILAMTLAMCDCISPHLLERQGLEEIVQVFKRINEHAPSASTLIQATRKWLPTVLALLAKEYARIVAQPLELNGVPMYCLREGSRVAVRGVALDLPTLHSFVDDVAAGWHRGFTPSMETEAVATAPSRSPLSQCWSWCWPSSGTSTTTSKERTHLLTRRASVKVAEQQHDRAKLCDASSFESANEQKHERVRKHAQRRRNTMTWASESGI